MYEVSKLLDSADALMMLDKFAGPPPLTKWERLALKWLPAFLVPERIVVKAAKFKAHHKPIPFAPGATVTFRRHPLMPK